MRLARRRAYLAAGAFFEEVFDALRARRRRHSAARVGRVERVRRGVVLSGVCARARVAFCGGARYRAQREQGGSERAPRHSRGKLRSVRPARAGDFARARRRRISSGFFGFRGGREFEGYGLFGAVRGAVETQNASREVERLALGVYALGLAVSLAQPAGDARGLVHHEPEQRHLGE